MDWKNRIVGYGEEAPERLVANPRNWRGHGEFQSAALGAILKEVGLVQNVIVNKQTGFIVDGHLRVEMAVKQGQPMIPVTYVDISPSEEALILATLDPLGALADKDQEKLGELLRDVQTDEEALQGLLAELANGLQESVDSGGGSGGTKAISPQLLERQDYLVFVCSSELDWRALCDEFKIETVVERPADRARKGIQAANKGVGRVLRASELLSRLRHD